MVDPSGHTWWGRAWIDALEGLLDSGRLSRGRTYARRGAVGPLRIISGAVLSEVEGNHANVYDTDIEVRKLADQEWGQLIDTIAAKAGHAAALLAGVLEPALIADAAEIDVRLLPGPGDLRPHCSCPDWVEPCKHAAALCYLVADELDRDPFQLLLLRGMDRETLLARVRERRPSASGPAERAAAEGVIAKDAWAAQPEGAGLAPVPAEVHALGRLHDHPIGAAPADGLPLAPGVDPGQLAALADDAAVRAWSMLADGSPSGLRSNFNADLARRARDVAGTRRAAAFAASAGIPLARLQAWSAAWELAGDRGVSIVADPDNWSTDQEVLEAGRAALVHNGHPQRSIGLSWNGLRMRDGVLIVAGVHGGWFRLQERGSGRRELHLIAGPVADVTDLVEPVGRGE